MEEIYFRKSYATRAHKTNLDTEFPKADADLDMDTTTVPLTIPIAQGKGRRKTTVKKNNAAVDTEMDTTTPATSAPSIAQGKGRRKTMSKAVPIKDTDMDMDTSMVSISSPFKKYKAKRKTIGKSKSPLKRRGTSPNRNSEPIAKITRRNSVGRMVGQKPTGFYKKMTLGKGE